MEIVLKNKNILIVDESEIVEVLKEDKRYYLITADKVFAENKHEITKTTFMELARYEQIGNN